MMITGLILRGKSGSVKEPHEVPSKCTPETIDVSGGPGSIWWSTQPIHQPIHLQKLGPQLIPSPD